MPEAKVQRHGEHRQRQENAGDDDDRYHVDFFEDFVENNTMQLQPLSQPWTPIVHSLV